MLNKMNAVRLTKVLRHSFPSSVRSSSDMRYPTNIGIREKIRRRMANRLFLPYFDEFLSALNLKSRVLCRLKLLYLIIIMFRISPLQRKYQIKNILDDRVLDDMILFESEINLIYVLKTACTWCANSCHEKVGCCVKNIFNI
jgi:hypothetical protein